MKALIEHLGYAPETCVWELTRACNLRCAHCGTGAGKSRADELSTDEAVDVAIQLARLGNRLTTLSGGEPTLRRDWPAIAQALIARGVTVNLVTNGQGDGGELASLARDTGLANVAVSLDGLETTHDLLRGHGAFGRATDTIRQLVRAGIWVDVMFTVNCVNLSEMTEVWKWADNLSAKRFRVQLGKPMGNQTHRADLTLSPKDLLTLMPRLGRLAALSGPEVRIGDSIGYFSPEERVLRGRYCDQGHWTGCYAGVRAIGIQADGGVKGCLSLQPRAGEADPFIEGNLHHDSLEAIWLRPGAFAYNREFMPSSLKGACAKCSHASLCRGGATCVAYSYLGELGCDPMCHFQAAGQSAETRQRVWPVSASAAATAILMSLGGCGGESTSSGKSGTNGGAPASTSNSSAKAGQSPSTNGQGGTTAGANGGAANPTSASIPFSSGTGGALVASGGSAPSSSSSAIASGGGVSSAMDYGVVVPTGGVASTTGGKAGAPSSSARAGAAGNAGASAVSARAGSAGVVIMTSGGTAGHTGVTHPSSAGAGAASNVAGNAGRAGASAVDCSRICCGCDYGIVPPEDYRICCG